MSNSKQPKDHHWKLIVNRKNRMQIAFESSVNKRKFTPLKDNSMRDSKVFEKSRERSNSSFHGLNKSRQFDSVSIRDKKETRMGESIRQMPPQPSTLVSTIKTTDFKGTQSIEIARQHASTFREVVQLQKQFRQFKDKVMKLLQRQQQQINSLAKEIVHTFQYELGKLKELKVQKCEHCRGEGVKEIEVLKDLKEKTGLDGKLETAKGSKVKELEEIKQELNKKMERRQDTKMQREETRMQRQQVPKSDSKIGTLQRAKSAKEIPALNFSGLHSRFDNVFEIFSKLKADMSEMQEIRSNLAIKTGEAQSLKR